MRDIPGLTGVCIGHYGNLYVRGALNMNKGERFEGHTHQHNHILFLTAGSIRMTVEGHETCYHAPNFIWIHRDHEHSVEALEDHTDWWCVIAMRNEDEPIQEAVSHSQAHDPLYEASCPQ